ncbi:MAG: response regulator transcription factor [Thiobacillus sp.]|nr:response regulator transcription factor [Thiobacillus sp.]
MRILIVEDDEVLADSLIRAMVGVGYATDHAGDGERALSMLLDGCYDLAIMDINLPRMDGLCILKHVRAAKKSLPVILLTARDSIEDRVLGLDLGADDYLTKPFSLAELEARVRALLRRGQGGGAAKLTCGGLEFDSVGRRVTLAGEAVELSARELAVLETLLFRQGKVVSKEQLIESLCAWGDEVTPNAIEVYMHRLRKKLVPGGIDIRTVRGLGYLLDKA